MYIIDSSNHNEGVPPDSIPNSAVKTFSADDTLIGKVGRCFFYYFFMLKLTIAMKKNQSFSLLIKQEIIKRKYKKSEEKALICGILASSLHENNYAYLIINNYEVFLYINDLLKRNDVEFELINKNKFKVSLGSLDCLTIKKQKEYFSGIFLKSGSINNINSVSYHLELKFFNENIAIESMNILNTYNLNFKLLKRKYTYVIYAKKIENICDFLKAIEVYQAYLNFEETKISRDFTNNINRLTNFDYYNQEKIAYTNSLFLDNFSYIKKHNHEDLFNKNELIFYELKEQNLDLSLSDLVFKMKEKKIHISKSSLNRYLKKLNDFVLKNRCNSEKS